MFDRDQFFDDCRRAVAEGQKAVREVVTEAVSNPSTLFAELGEPEHAGIVPIYKSSDLTIMNFAWAPYMSQVPHNHKLPSIVGIYAGREDNVLWRRTDNTIEAAGAKSLGVGDVAILGRDVIHSVLNPIGKMTCALHVYGGDFLSISANRSQWDHETHEERPWDIDEAKSRFREAEARFSANAST
jgi:predicted metal-dependent enzyme (double-stranded beta helix superfamily)